MSRVLSSASPLFNAVIYKIGWLACVVGAAVGWGTAGALVAIGLTALHAVLAERPEREWPLLLAAAALGMGLDTFHAAAGVLDFRGHQAGSIAPIWIVALWLQFATTLHFSLRWLSRRYALAAVLGLTGGPLAFLAGERIGAATFGDPRALSLAVIGLSWAIALPTLVAIADRLGWPGRYRLLPAAAAR